jgi:hypothetical protein
MTDPVVTYTISIDRDGNITNDTQCHGSSFADVYRAFRAIKAEIDRQIDQRRECPFNPRHGGEPVFAD